jgi:arabinogalactan oligomer/maltooligosaccharide transport system permease protein
MSLLSTARGVDAAGLGSRLRRSLDRNSGLLLVAPGLFLFAGFMFFPMAFLVYLSLFEGNVVQAITGGTTWVGVGNYVGTLTSPGFWGSMVYTMGFVASSVVLKICLALVVALALNHDRVRGKRLLRSVVILPMGLPVIFSVEIWSKIFSPARFGLANKLWFALGGEEAIAWFTSDTLLFFTYNVTEVWLAYPFLVIIIVSALQDVSEELHDAARVDGAGYVQRFWHVTLPSIKRPVLFGAILTAAASFQQFLIPFVFTTGRSGRAGETVLLYGYREALNANQYGEGASIMIIAVMCIGGFMWLAVKKGDLTEGVAEE